MTTVTYQERLQSDLSLLCMVADSLVARPQNYWRFDDAHHSMSTDTAKEALQVLLSEFSPVPWRNLSRDQVTIHIMASICNLRAGSPVENLAAHALQWGFDNHPRRRSSHTHSEDMDFASIRIRTDGKL